MWGFYPLTTEGMKNFLDTETWLTLEVWNSYQEDQIKKANSVSKSTANLASMLESMWIAFNDSKNVKGSKPENFLPYREFDPNALLNTETIEIYWNMVNQDKVPAFVRRAIQMNPELHNNLESGRKIVQ